MRMLRAGGVYEFIRSGPKWTELIKVETNGPNGLTKNNQNGQNGPNRTEVVLMDRKRPKWYRTKMHQI